MDFVSIRSFIGAKDYDVSRAFYRALDFEEHVLSEKMCYFSRGSLGFYLQDYYIKKWVDNSMIFMEVADVEACYEWLQQLNLPSQFKGVRLSKIQDDWWGRECFLHDPSGVLWHFGQFAGNKR